MLDALVFSQIPRVFSSPPLVFILLVHPFGPDPCSFPLLLEMAPLELLVFLEV